MLPGMALFLVFVPLLLVPQSVVASYEEESKIAVVLPGVPVTTPPPSPLSKPRTPPYKPPMPPIKPPTTPVTPPVKPPTTPVTPPVIPPVKSPTTPIAPPVKPPTPLVKPPVYTPTPPVKPPTPPVTPPVKPPTLPVKPPPSPVTPPSYAPPPARTKIDCVPLCGRRCSLHSRKNVCMRACITCCYRCKCVPPGTYGNKEKCGKCYTDMRTRGNRPKCP